MSTNTRSEASPDRPLDQALNVIGDRWSLLVIHAIAQGLCRFNQIQHHTSMPRDRLALRLRRLESSAVIERVLYCAHPPRYEYGLTEVGKALDPALLELELWGARIVEIRQARMIFRRG